MNHPIRRPHWLSYSLALLLTIALNWGLTQPVLAASATDTFIVTWSINATNNLEVSISVRSPGAPVPLTGSIIVQGSWGGGESLCVTGLTDADNRLTATGYAVSVICPFLSPAPIGVYTLTASYSGDSNYSPSTATKEGVVIKHFVDVAITAHTPNPSPIDQAVLVQYSVASRNANDPFIPTGTVFVTDGVNSCLSTVANGQCSLILETAGTRTLTASYSGDSNFFDGSTSVSHTVIGYASTTRITADTPDPSNQGQAVTVSYSVVANDPSKGTPSGNVTVSDGVDSCTGTVAAGSCALTLSTAGARTLTATYAGNTKFAGSTSADEPHTVTVPDTTLPTITASGTKADGTPYTPDTWTNQNVTVHFTCSDADSGIAVCPDDQVFSPDGAFTAEGTARDNAGNTASASFGPIKIDKTAPTVTVSGTKADGTPYTLATWINQNVTVHFTCSDAGSGIAVCPGDQVISPDGSFTAQGTARDNAGNTASASFGPIKIDKTKPVITSSRTPAANSAGWNNSDVTVSFTCADTASGSGLATNTVAGATVSTEGANQAVTNSGVCVDNAGNAADAVTVSGINLDKTAPTINAATTTPPNANGWYNSAVTVQFTCADNLSNVTSCPADQVLNNEGSAVSSTAQTGTDGAGNQSAASNVVTVQIDKTAPVVTVTGVSNGASYTLGSVPTAGCSTSDALSGVATQATLSVTGGGGTGRFTATCSGATDNAGNSNSASVIYSVTYNWTGFFQPVDNLPIINTVNAGQAIPVKFSLGGNFGLNIFASGYPISQKVSCGSGGSGSTSPIDQTMTAGNSGLQYDATTQTYTYVWKTDKAWAGTCRTLTVKLIDGTEHTALFQFNDKVSGAAADGEAAVTQQVFLPLVSR